MGLRDKYDPDYHYGKSRELIDIVTKEDAEAWFSHPCTKSLIQTLEGDYSGLLIMWVGGGYSNEDSSDATAQLQAKARGQAQAIDDVIEQINNLRNIIKYKEEEYETGN